MKVGSSLALRANKTTFASCSQQSFLWVNCSMNTIISQARSTVRVSMDYLDDMYSLVSGSEASCSQQSFLGVKCSMNTIMSQARSIVRVSMDCLDDLYSLVSGSEGRGQ